ncbi:MAG: thiamine pyrophosphate-dependent enzyme [Parachlamydiales bacterium]
MKNAVIERNLISSKPLLRTLEVMLLSRLTDLKMEKLVKQNKGGTFQLSAAGHEMIGAVASAALRPGKDWACCYYRDQPMAFGLGCDLVEAFAIFMGREAAHHSKGRMMPYHFSHKGLRMPTQSSVVATQFLPAVGIAKGIQLEGKDEVVYVSGGDGATSEGDFPEALNFAVLHKLPVIFMIHDNDFAISVPLSEQVSGGSIAENFSRPGLDLHDIDGCDHTALAGAMKGAVQRARAGEGPSLIVAKVPRLGSHSNSDDPRKYRDPKELEATQKRDPIARYESWLTSEGHSTRAELDKLRKDLTDEIERAVAQADKVPFPKPETAGDHVFVPYEIQETPLNAGEQVVMVDAINHALAEEMERNPHMVVFGEDVAHNKGGVFGATRGLTATFGPDRCFNTPLAESTIVGLALGLSLDGTHTPVGEIQFAEYLWPGFDQLASEVASITYRSGGEWNVPLVLRMPYGGYIQGGPYHSQSIEGILAQVPGLKIVIPSNAADAKGLLKASIRDPNPVIFLEHKALYRQAKFAARPEPDADYILPLGKANIVREGRDLTVVGWGMMVVMAAELAPKLAQEGIEIEIVDLRTIVPYDAATVTQSVQKTGKLLIAHESPITCGFGAEIAAQVAHDAFEYLDGPIKRVCGLDTAIPYSKPLENAVLPQLADLEAGIREVAEY